VRVVLIRMHGRKHYVFVSKPAREQQEDAHPFAYRSQLFAEIGVAVSAVALPALRHPIRLTLSDFERLLRSIRPVSPTANLDYGLKRERQWRYIRELEFASKGEGGRLNR
jgi:hypothetical protein